VQTALLLQLEVLRRAASWDLLLAGRYRIRPPAQARGRAQWEPSEHEARGPEGQATVPAARSSKGLKAHAMLIGLVYIAMARACHACRGREQGT
jgi:hypothetical protein